MNESKGNAISVSLLNRKIYTVRCTGFEPLAAFHDEFYDARRRFFETGKTVRIKKAGVFGGLSGTVEGKISRHKLQWEKCAGNDVLEQSFVRGGQRGIDFFTPTGILQSRMYFDRELHWLRTEYFAPDDATRAKAAFKAEETRDAIVRFDYNHSTGKTKETTLFPVPYTYQSPEQSLQNARFGDALLLVADETGEFCYCPREEQQSRLKFIKNHKDASVLLSMGWEVKDGEVQEAEPEDDTRDTDYIFAGIEETVRTAREDAPDAVLRELFENEERAPEIAAQPTDALIEALGVSAEEAVYVRNVLDRVLQKKDAPEATDTEAAAGLTLIRDGREESYTGHMENGRREGFGRTETPAGVTVYEGEYKDDKRDGFGAHHYASGAVSYIGDFKADTRDGFGVSFREDDHALHVSHWENGAPAGFASLFDPSGTLRYMGQIVDGQKQGVGVSVNPENDTVFVGKYRDNELTGDGALFDSDGTLLYMGQWKDGVRHGRGTQFDRDGDVVYAGEWENDAYKNGILYKKVEKGD